MGFEIPLALQVLHVVQDDVDTIVQEVEAALLLFFDTSAGISLENEANAFEMPARSFPII